MRELRNPRDIFSKIWYYDKVLMIEDLLQYGDLDGYVRGSISAIQTHIQHLPGEPAGRAIYRIVQYMGYQDYLK